MIEACRDFLSTLPSCFNSAFAYGSAILSSNKSNKMIDIILVVDSASSFHNQNLIQNPKHYSLIRHLGPSHLSNFQSNRGARMFYNTLIPHKNSLYKYGVITIQDLISDLYDWDFLYASGRLHKPVMPLTSGISTDLSDALRTNLASALHTSLLLLPETFSEEELFRKIVWLSYNGDFRMTLGEDRGKIQDIVAPNVSLFRSLYGPEIENLQGHLCWHQKEKIFEQELNFSSRLYHLNHLPKNLQLKLWHRMNVEGRNPDIEEVLMSLAHNPSEKMIVASLRDIVWSSCVSQALKGVVTAGFIKSVKYSSSKLYKMFKSIK